MRPPSFYGLRGGAFVGSRAAQGNAALGEREVAPGGEQRPPSGSPTAVARRRCTKPTGSRPRSALRRVIDAPSGPPPDPIAVGIACPEVLAQR